MWVVVYRNRLSDDAVCVEFDNRETYLRFIDKVDASPSLELIRFTSKEEI